MRKLRSGLEVSLRVFLHTHYSLRYFFKANNSQRQEKKQKRPKNAPPAVVPVVRDMSVTNASVQNADSTPTAPHPTATATTVGTPRNPTPNPILPPTNPARATKSKTAHRVAGIVTG